MSSSSSSSYIAFLNSLQIYTHRIGDSILVPFGTISCLLNLIIFTRKDFRKNPCAIYYIAYNIANLLYIYFVIFITLLQWGYYIDPGAHNIAYCRFRFYLYYLFAALSPTFLILASIDRTLITSSTIHIRQLSTRRLAFIVISSMTLFWMIFHIHTLIYINIYQLAPYYYSCSYAPGIYTTFTNYYQLVVRGLLATLLMIVFGLLTVKNIRRAHRTAAAVPVANSAVSTVAVGHNTNYPSQKDRQFIFMMCSDIIIYVFCGILRPIYMIYVQATQYQTKSDKRQAIEAFINSLTLFITFIPTCTGFYTYFLVSKSFRQNAKKVLQTNRIYNYYQLHKCTRNT
ncbi:unnamed protein product [Adineta steineri]|uniref:G-protein coupled receptors family 1 profile domain-containing protein n=2 Tax=Adineta steineri TaxID=433720 RepID=A0A814B686_9BILA|nr:unnamed protein product [Adineta steineri]